jgi:hypothetical protein
MTGNQRVISLPSVVLGLCLMFVGTALALDRLHIVEAAQVLRLWPVGLILLGASLVLQAVRGGASDPAGGTTVHAGFHGGHLLGMLVLAAIVAQAVTNRDWFLGVPEQHLNLVGVLRGDERSSNSSRFRGAHMTSVMGKCVLDLRQARVAPGEAMEIDVFALMGGAVVQVPADWTVDVRAASIMSGVRDRRSDRGRFFGLWRGRDRRRQAEADDSTGDSASPAERRDSRSSAPRLVIRGAVIMGGLIVES